MTPARVTITVQGAFTAFRPAERGTVRASVALEGPEAEAIHAAVTRGAAGSASSGKLVLAPEDIKVSAEVDARFEIGA
jgi:hypothetical protein